MKKSHGDILPKGSNLRRFVCGTKRLGVEFDDDEGSDMWPSVIETFRDHVRAIHYDLNAWPNYPNPLPNVYDVNTLDNDLNQPEFARAGNKVRWLGFQISIRVNMNTNQAYECVEAPPGTFNGQLNTNGGITVRLMLVVDLKAGVFFGQPGGWDVVQVVLPTTDYGMFVQGDAIEYTRSQSCIFDRRICVSSTGESIVNEQHFIDCDFISKYQDNDDLPLTNRVRALGFSNATRELVNAEIYCRVKGFFITSN